MGCVYSSPPDEPTLRRSVSSPSADVCYPLGSRGRVASAIHCQRERQLSGLGSNGLLSVGCYWASFLELVGSCSGKAGM